MADFMNNRIAQLVRNNIRTLAPYSTARDEFKGSLGVFLDANESPYPNPFNRYPDPHQKILKEKISALKGMPVEKIFLGNGSDEAIDLMYRIFCTPGKDNAIVIAPSYGMYSVCAEINDVEVRSVELNPDWSLPEEKLLEAADDNSKLMFICSPNNPTANAFPKEQILRIVQKFNGIVVVDEAYADFSTKGSLLPELASNDNMVVLQTMSKARGLAGLRLGMAFADSCIIRFMSMVKYPYNINQATINEALKVLDKNIGDEISEILSERERLSAELIKFKFIKEIFPSDANFILIRTDDANSLYDHLIKDGIIVRNRNSVKGCKGCLRITIGLTSENEKLLSSLKMYQI